MNELYLIIRCVYRSLLYRLIWSISQFLWPISSVPEFGEVPLTLWPALQVELVPLNVHDLCTYYNFSQFSFQLILLFPSLYSLVTSIVFCSLSIPDAIIGAFFGLIDGIDALAYSDSDLYCYTSESKCCKFYSINFHRNWLDLIV